VLDCPCCGGWLRLLALIEYARIVERILRHLGLPADRPERFRWSGLRKVWCRSSWAD
jgi:hypothetical protein